MIRKCVISNILATDIKQHFELIKQFEIKFSGCILKKNNAMESSSGGGNKVEYTENDINLITNMIIHAADFHGNS